MDVWFRRTNITHKKKRSSRRNPCCSGCLVSTGLLVPDFNFSYVAILVVVDVWFRRRGSGCQRVWTYVAILVVVDVWFRPPCRYVASIRPSVAILVVVDVWFRRTGLALVNICMSVAILVVVDVWFRRWAKEVKDNLEKVAILVVVDVWFRPYVNDSDISKIIRRNPCCSGCLVSTRRKRLARKTKGRRNPCCSGCLVSTDVVQLAERSVPNVAILVVVDVWFRHYKSSPPENWTKGRNPCCSGCLVSTQEVLFLLDYPIPSQSLL